MGEVTRRVRWSYGTMRYAGQYHAWRDAHLLAGEHKPLTLRHGDGRNLVLGVATGYSWKKLAPFVLSLRRFSACRVVLVVSSEETANALETEGVDAIMAAPATGYRPHQNFARTGTYLDILQRVAGQIDRVFLVDTRDVVFQADPFASSEMDAALIFFEEADGFTYAAKSINRRWLRETFGRAMLDGMASYPIICSGTVLASHGHAVTYCRQKLLLASAVTEGRHLSSGVDQVTTNLIARMSLLPGARVCDARGAVATVYANRDYLAVRDDRMVSKEGHAPAVVHQYDRVPELVRLVNVLYRAAASAAGKH